MRRIGSTLLLALVVLAGACGSSSKSSQGSGGALSKADFISQGEAICKDADSKAPTTTPSEGDAKGISTWLDGTLSVLADARTRFNALKAPSDAQQLQKDFVASIDSITGSMKAAKAKADAGDAQGATTAMQGAADTDAIAKRMDAYGFKVCGTNNGE